MNFLKTAISENRQIFYGIIGGFCMFSMPVLIDMYVRPFLRSLY